MSVLYLHVTYEDYKHVEEQMRTFAETAHKSTGGFYHKSIRLKIGGDLILEVHGPLVGGYGHESADECAICELGNRASLHDSTMQHFISSSGRWIVCGRRKGNANEPG